MSGELTEGLVVVGGGPAGHAAALAYRDAGGTGPVRLISADAHRPYDRPPLTKDFLRGESGEADLPLASESEYRDRDIEVRLDSRVVSIDPRAHQVIVEDGEHVPYGSCIWAAGSRPASLQVPGADDPAVLRVRSLDEGRRLRDTARVVSTAVVIGSGFIGCEAAASLAVRGVDVTVVSMEDHPQAARLGRAAAERIAAWLTELGVDLVLGSGVAAIQGGRRVVLDDGTVHNADLVLVAPGIVPCSHVVEVAGVTVESGRVVVDQHMKTSVPDLYAAGDVVIAHNPTAGRRLPVEHWGEALAMGEVAGISAAGGDASWDAVPGFWTEIAGHTLKYAAWGDGFDDARLVDHGDGAFTVWYSRGGKAVGVLAHEADQDYELGGHLVAHGEPIPR